MSSSDRPPESSSRLDRVGHIYGTGFLGGVEWYVGRYGPAAAHAVIARLSPAARAYVVPNSPNLGILGAKKYPYAIVGELVRAMAAAVRLDEDALIRELSTVGVDATIDTVARVAVRWIVSPESVVERSPDLWRTFHDCGTLRITWVSEREFLSEVSNWPHHDLTVCKMCVEGGRRLVERSGVERVEARREKCQSWGHTSCVTRVRWA